MQTATRGPVAPAGNRGAGASGADSDGVSSIEPTVVSLIPRPAIRARSTISALPEGDSAGTITTPTKPLRYACAPASRSRSQTSRRGKE